MPIRPARNRALPHRVTTAPAEPTPVRPTPPLVGAGGPAWLRTGVLLALLAITVGGLLNARALRRR